MTSTKQIILGFFFIALDFGFLLLALTAVGASPNTILINLFVSYPPEISSALSGDAVSAIRVEQGIGLTLLILGCLFGAIGCFRRP
jgi:hypothetical protein